MADICRFIGSMETILVCWFVGLLLISLLLLLSVISFHHVPAQIRKSRG